jgi:UDP-N-acetylglucosamine 2-epimerase
MSHDYFISWGKFFTKQLQPYNKKVKFLDFGYLSSKKIKFKKNKVVFFLQPYDFSFTQNSFLELCELAFRLAKKFPDWNFVIREHPDFTFEDLYSKNFKLNIKNIILEKYIRKNLSESLSESKISVGISSSALIESLFFDTIPCVLQLNKNMKFVPNFKKLKIGFVESNSDSMEHKISNLISNKNFLSKMQKNIIMKKVIFFQNTKKKSVRLISGFLNNKLF